MTKSTNHMVGLVFAHRWFRDGANWAYHPEIRGDTLRSLAQGLDSELSDRQSLPSTGWRSFRLKSPIRGLDLVGIHKIDEQCQDPKARNPSILIGMFISGNATLDSENIISLLAHMVPTNLGPKEGYKVQSNTRKKKNRKKVWLMRGVIAAGIVGITLVLQSRAQSYVELRSALYSAMRDVAGGESNAIRKDIWRTFVNIYCEPADRLDGVHPDLERLRSLLPRRERSDHRWSVAEQTLNDWSLHVGLDKSLNNPTSEEIERRVKAIVEGLDYRRWFEEQLRTDSSFRAKSFTGSNSVAEKWRARSVRLCDAQDVMLTDYSRYIYKLLKVWDVEEVHENDVEVRPWFVIHAFFAFLNRERFDLPAKDDQTAFDLFVSRLPATNVLAGSDYTFSTFGDIDRNLQSLIDAILSEPVGRMDIHSALATVENALNYEDWRSAEVNRLEESRGKALDEERFKDYTRLNEMIRHLNGSADEKSKDNAINEFVERFIREGQP